jgi:DNA-binding transcriptional ArsR family regulator
MTEGSECQPGRLTANGLAAVGSAIGDPTRAHILAALMGGQALTAGELAYRAGVTAPTISGHLAKLRASGLIVDARQGRHLYVRIASPEVAAALEALMGVAASTTLRHVTTGPSDIRLRRARACYDHLAGQLGVAIADALARSNAIAIDFDRAELTDEGATILRDRLGIELTNLAHGRPICRPCIDWSERRPHLAGHVGAAILEHMLKQDWLRRCNNSRAVDVTDAGVQWLGESLEIRWTPTNSASNP